jgi:hypothetical protein
MSSSSTSQYDGPGLAKGGTGILTVDGHEVARQTIPHTTPALDTLDEWMDVGYDTRTGVDIAASHLLG